MADQYLRKASLVVSAGGQGLDLSALHFTFEIKQYDLQTPTTVRIRVYNLSDQGPNSSVDQIQKEFTRVTLQAGYQTGNYGLIFDGTIVQVRRGRENATDTYVDIIGAVGDEAANFAVVNTSLAAGKTFKDRADALTKAMGAQGVTPGYQADMPGGALPRGKVMYGMARDHFRDLAFSTDTKWSIQNGDKLQIIALNGYMPGDAVVLNSNTGMIGLPEQTQDGIKIRSLLNPQILIGGRVQIDNKSIQQATLGLGVQATAQNAFIPSIADDGFYRVVVHEMRGDIRGNDWYSDMICIAMNQAVPPSLVARGYS